MNQDQTMLFHLDLQEDLEVKKTLKEVYVSLKERGYNPVNQIVGYLISGDLGYISSYQNARHKMQTLNRSKIIEVLLTDTIGK